VHNIQETDHKKSTASPTEKWEMDMNKQIKKRKLKRSPNLQTQAGEFHTCNSSTLEV
jgi:hypothetical protein